jgi:glutathione synthase/RimK-type ligase-like ATP-grasp enzyme
VRILITTSRLPFALGLIRKLAAAGHEVHTSDAFAVAPGSHSRWLSGHTTTAPPAQEPERFIADIEGYCREHGIERIVPAFEEAFYLATQRDRLAETAELFTAPFATLARLHDKATFTTLAQELGLPLPETITCRSDEDLADAVARWPQWFARAAFSRGGVGLLTNTGPLAGHTRIEDVHPTPEQPWLVQPFVDGPMLCTYSSIRGGRVIAHLCYRAPRQWQHSTGIAFETIGPGPSLEIVQKLAAKVGYTGQMAIDLIDAGNGALSVVECNPRATDGALLLTDEEADIALGRPPDEVPDEPILVEAGRTEQLDFAVFGQMFTEPPSQWPKSIHDLIHVQGSDRGWHDQMPNLYSLLTLGRSARLNLRDRKALLAAMADDIAWDGQPIPGMSDSDRALIDEMEADR